MSFRLSLLLALISSSSAFAAARQAAPLPPHWTSEGGDEEEDGYIPTPFLSGSYGHGFANPNPDLRPDSPVCQGSEAEQSELAEKHPYLTEFWFYATDAQAALFRRDARIDSSKACAEALGYHYRIERAFSADGLIHSFEVEDGEWDAPLTRPVNGADGVYSGGFNLIHNLMARISLPKGRSTHGDMVAGIRARCGGFSGLVWHQTCVAASGRLRGMILTAVAGDDERELFHLSFNTLVPDINIEGKVFEVDRDWRGPRNPGAPAVTSSN